MDEVNDSIMSENEEGRETEREEENESDEEEELDIGEDDDDETEEESQEEGEEGGAGDGEGAEGGGGEGEGEGEGEGQGEGEGEGEDYDEQLFEEWVELGGMEGEEGEDEDEDEEEEEEEEEGEDEEEGEGEESKKEKKEEKEIIAGNERRSRKDVIPLEVRQGRDVQGIMWGRGVGDTSREEFKAIRKHAYLTGNCDNLNFVETPEIKAKIEKEKLEVSGGKQMFKFHYNARSVSTSIVHPQLRNLLWATNKHDIYYTYNFVMRHYNTETGLTRGLVDLSGQAVTPLSVIPSSLPADFLQYRRVMISSTHAAHGYFVAGGFKGEVVVLDMNRGELLYNDRISFDENAITNALDINCVSNGDVRVICSNNDCVIRTLHLPTMRPIHKFSLDYCVNYSVLSPDKKLLMVVGDHPQGLIMDAESGQVLTVLKGHYDYGFAAAWHPNGRLVATGHQDRTARLWDIRYPSVCYGLLQGELAAIRSIRFTSDGKYMAMAESADYVHVYDVDTNFNSYQAIDIIGSISGISFSPCGEILYIGNADTKFGGIMEYVRHRPDDDVFLCM